MSSRFLELVEEKKRVEAAARAAEQNATAVQEEKFDADLIPEAYERTDEERSLDEFVDNIDIIDAYRRWSNKGTVEVRPGQVESIKIRCPNPDHQDLEKSAWVNTQKQTGNCGICGGFDAHDIAAWNLGFGAGYKKDGSFPKLRQAMAEEFGWTFHRTIGGEYYAEPPSDGSADTWQEAAASQTDTDNSDTADTPDISSISELEPANQPTDSNNVIPLYDDGDQEPLILPALPWRDLVPQDSFIYRYMEITTEDDITEEYHFFNSLFAVGFALGREVKLFDLHPVYGNLFVCTLGRTGSGKSQARSYLNTLLAGALKFDHSADFPKGVRRLNSPGSAETLIDAFVHPVIDPNSKKVVAHAPIKAYIDFSELSSMLGRSNRAGSVLKPTLMQFYDMDAHISTSSRTHGEATAHEAFASCSTTTQPKALRDLVSSSDDASGFLNRWLFVGGPEKRGWH